MNIVIKASAGTGKTYKLSLHYIRLLISGSNPEDILVTTFTKKATAEIKERILSQLRALSKRNKFLMRELLDLGCDFINFERVKEIYNQLLFNKDKLRVYTIDSFINSIFKKFVVPYFNFYGYKMINNDENLSYLEEILENIIQSESKFAELNKFFSMFLEKDATTYLKWIGEFITSRWKFLKVEGSKKSFKSSQNIEKSFENVLEKLMHLIKVKRLDSSLHQHLKDDFKEISTIVNKKEYLDKNYSLFLGYKGEDGFWNGVKLKKSKKHLKEHNALVESYEKFKRTLASHIFNNKLIPLEKEIFKLANVIFKEYDALKSLKKGFTHDDVLIYTYKFIYQFAGHSKEVFEQFVNFNNAYILIDEFQDTSVLQWSILKLLINGAKQFVAVGDEKQAIYRWRGGERDLLLNLPKIFECKEEMINTCYRSEKWIIKFNNNLFKELGVLAEPTRYLKGKEGGYVELSLSDRKDQKQLLIDSIVRKNMKIKDIAIIARTNAELEEIETYLQELEIPYIKEGALSIVNHRAVRPIHLLAKFIKRGEFVDLISFLRSDLINISSQQMKELFNCRDEVTLFFEGEEIELRFHDILKRILFKIRKIKSYDDKDIIRSIVKEFGIIEVYGSKGDTKNISKFYEISREHVNLSAFLEYLEENKGSEELRQVGVGESNAITLMTVHKAKGLEFETVFVAWNFSSRSINNSKLSLNLEFSQNFNEIVNCCFTSTEMSSILKYYGKNYQKLEKEKEINEELNNFYVAMTRAKRNLILFASFDRSSKTLEMLNHQNAKSEGDIYVNKVKHAIMKSTKSEDGLSRLFMHNYVIGKFEQSIEEVKDTRVKPGFKLLMKDFEKKAGPVQERTIIEGKEKAVRKINYGVIAHYFLSLIKEISQDVELAKKRTFQKFQNIFGTEIIEKIISLSIRAIERDAAFALDGKSAYNEAPIFVRDEEIRVDKIVIDEKSKKIEVIDYKTGSLEQQQLKEYVEAVKSMFTDYEVSGRIINIEIEKQSI